MTDESKVPKDRLSLLRRIRPYRLAFASVALMVLAAGTLIAFRRFPQLSTWEVPLGGGAAALTLVILWKFPQWQVSNVRGLEPKERFDRVNEARKTLAQIVGGIAVLAGFYSTVQNINIAREGQITDRFSKAIEQLGAVDSNGKKKLEVRLGGIYSLERIANESPTDHWPIMEVLTAYVRENAKKPKQVPVTQALVPQELVAQIPADIQAILTVIGRRSTESERFNQVLDLHETSLNTAYLIEADLRRADLRGADLSKADLFGAGLERARLNGAKLTGARLNTADLSRADLSKADLSGARLGFASLFNAHINNANLSGADVIGSHLNFVNLSGANLRGAYLVAAELDFADLSGAELNGAELSGAHLRTAKNLTQQQIDSANGNTKTQLPDGLRMPEGWKSHQIMLPADN